MINFILNNQSISTDEAAGTTVLDFVRYRKNLKGTKIGCREGDCGACTVLVGELSDGEMSYRTMTSCLMPLANADGKHIVSIEGINPDKRGLTPVQQAMVDESGTQCGFCTVGFVMSLTGFCIDTTQKSNEMAVSSVDGNICRCTGYKSIERAACRVSGLMSEKPSTEPGLAGAIEKSVIPGYFADIATRLNDLRSAPTDDNPDANEMLPRPFVGGGTDLYVQRHDEMTESEAAHLFYDDQLRGIRDTGTHIEIGASATVTDLLVSPVMQAIFPDLFRHLKLVSSTPIRNMATVAGNFINASPIGDMTVWFLALDAEISLETIANPSGTNGQTRNLPLRNLYLGYKQLAKADDEFISAIRFRKPSGDFRFNFEKVCKRTYLDIATVNTAISLKIRSMPGDTWQPPALSETGVDTNESSGVETAYTILDAHVAAGGVSPVPLYLKETTAFLIGKPVTARTIADANAVMQGEVSPISDVRGTEAYKRLLLRQLFYAHFHELFAVTGLDIGEGRINQYTV